MAEVIWSRAAAFDLLDITEYISRDSVKAAEGLVVSITVFPKMGRIVPEDKAKAHREIIVKKYRVIYRVEGGICYIVGVVDSRRDLNKMIEELGLLK